MDIKITDSALRKFLDTPADAETLSKNISLCGPTFDRIKKVNGDVLYEIEAITNRIDTASAQGVAREAAVILSQFEIPAKLINDPYKETISLPKNLSKQFDFKFDDKLVLRFVAIALENVSIKPSPKSTIELLENCGQRPINNCIDITNELTILYGMPSHIFDLDKLGAQKLHVRESKKDEIITTLDLKKNTLKGGNIVIEDGTGNLVDLCGVMGGAVAEVDNHTKNILLIVPVYDHKKIRRTSLQVQNRTLAAQLYEKQPDPELCLPVTMKAVQLFKERSGATPSSSVFDYYPATQPPKLIELKFDWLNKFIGITIDTDIVVSILSNLGFGGIKEEDKILCTVPSWRYHDINIKEDLAEEVARIYGYFRLPSVLPNVNLPSEQKNPLLETEKKIKNFLAISGFTEIFNSSLTSKQNLTNCEINTKDMLKLKNSLSSDFEYLRPSLIPSIIQNFRNNVYSTDENIKIFEVSNCYFPKDTPNMSEEVPFLGIITSDNYLTTKGYLEALFKHLKVGEVKFQSDDNPENYYNPTTTAKISINHKSFGKIGLLKPTVLRKYGLESTATIVELNLNFLSGHLNKDLAFDTISPYPPIIEEITIESTKPIGEIIDTIASTSRLINEVRYLQTFKGKHSFKLIFGSHESNLNQSEVDSLKEIVVKRLKTK